MAIRQPPSSINDPNLRGFLQELRNAIGKTGDQVAKVAMRVQQITNTPPPPTEPPVTPQPPQPPVNPGDGFPPPAPVSLTTTPDAWAIRLTWEQPATMPTDYDVTEIWCRNATSGEKLLAGSLRGNSFVFTGLDNHLLSNAETWYFWVRNKDVENLTSAFYPNDDVGVSGQALPSPENYIGDLISDITTGTLWDYLTHKIALLKGPDTMPNSVNQRLASQYNDLVQRISEVTVSSNGTFDTSQVWYFDTGLDGWTATGGGLISNQSGAVFFQSSATSESLRSPALSPAISMAAFPVIRARMHCSGWDGTIRVTNSANATFTFTPTTAPPTGSAFADYDWDLAAEFGVYNASAITRIEFVANAANISIYADWIAIGRLAPGASYSQVEAIRVRSDKKNRVFFQANGGAPNYAGPSNPFTNSDGTTYTLVIYDLWFDTATAVLDGTTGALLRGGNKPYRWSGTAWEETTDTRLADSWADIWELKQAAAVGNQSVAQWISGISATAAAADSAVQSKASVADVDLAFAGGGYTSLASRLTGIEASSSGANRVFIQSSVPTAPVGQAIGDLWYDTTDSARVILKRWGGTPLQWIVQRTDTKVYFLAWASRPTSNNLVGDLLYATDQNNKPYIWSITTTPPSWVPVLDNYITTNINAGIVELQRARIGYATVAIAHTYLGVAYAVGEIFEGNGTTIIYPVGTYSAAAYPQYAATDRKTIIDEQGVLNWNTIVGVTGAVKWNTGLPLATAIKQVRVSDGTDSLTIEQQFTAKKNTDNQLLGQYTVKIDTQNGWVGGFGLASEPASDGSPLFDFGVRADRFWLGAPTSPSLPTIGVGLADLSALAPAGSVIYYVTGRLTSATGTPRLYAYFQPSAAHGMAVGDWFTLRNIRASATTTSDNFHTQYNESFRIAGLQNAVYVGSSGVVTQNLFVNAGQFAILFEVNFQSVGYKTSQTTGAYSDPPKLIQQKYIPFIVTTTPRTIDNVLVPAGVYITDAYIRSATITNAKIADAAITMAKITKVIQSANFNGGFKVNGDLDPANPGTTGWAIDQPGTAILNSLVVRTGNIESNGVTNIIANSTNGLMSWRPSDLAYPIAVPLDGTRGRIALIITITIQAPSNAGCAVSFQAVVNNVRKDFKVAYSSAANGYGSCTIITYDNSLSTTINIGLDSTVVGGAPAYWSWGYILMDIKR